MLSQAKKVAKVILSSRDRKKGQEATQKLNESDLDVTFVGMDVHDPESIRQAAITVDERFGRLDVLINNAGAIWMEMKSY